LATESAHSDVGPVELPSGESPYDLLLEDQIESARASVAYCWGEPTVEQTGVEARKPAGGGVSVDRRHLSASPRRAVHERPVEILRKGTPT
jgi:hypothetical protein